MVDFVVNVVLLDSFIVFAPLPTNCPKCLHHRLPTAVWSEPGHSQFIKRAVKAPFLSRRRGIGEHVRAGPWDQRAERRPVREVGADLHRKGEARRVADDEGNQAVRCAGDRADAGRFG